jgi:diaminopropionate ammonia-lyase
LADDGKPRSVGGDLDTLMAGLACGDPSPLAWEVIDAYADGFIVIPDELAAKGMRIYASPIPGDSQVKSGESGAGGLGLLATIMGNSAYAGLREQLGLDETSQMLFISSEGDTDPVHYKEIVWEGSSPVSKQYYNEY